MLTQPATEARHFQFRGCPLTYWLHGDGHPTLFIQGVGVHGNGWLPQIETLHQHCQCLWFDNRGMGLSQPARSTISIPQMTEDTLALMDTLGWPSAHIVGHSLGGLVAQHLALTARPRVRSLSLLCTFFTGRQATSLNPWILWVGTRTRLGPRRWRRRAFLEIVMPPSVLASTDRDTLADSLAPLFGHDLADQPQVVPAQLAALKAYNPAAVGGGHREIAGIPTLIIAGQYDRLAKPAYAQSLAAAIPGSRYVEIPDAAHGLTIQRAPQINQLLLDHIQSADRAG